MIAPLPFPPAPPAGRPSEIELLQQYHPLVRQVVNRMRANLPPSVDVDDLHSIGLTGLVAAVRRYDAAQGRTFVAYAMQRIRGAILDELRRLDTLPRTARAQARELRAAVESLEQELGRAPTDAELQTRLGVDPATFARLRRRTQAVSLVSMEESRNGGSQGEAEGFALAETLPDPHATRSSDRLEAEETHSILWERVRNLPERPRRILELYYLEGRRLAEIATVFGVTEARICQIHAETLNSLRRGLSHALEA